jgi:hypothetical protein
MAGASSKVLSTACGVDLMRVETAGGRFLGHVFDLQCPWVAGAEPRPVDEIIYGRAGLLERVGLRERRPDSLPWSAVIELRGKVIVVADAAVPKTGAGRR